MPAATRVLHGTLTTDGVGAASTSIVTTGYRLRKVKVVSLSLTGGTVSAKDNGGLGAERLPATSIVAAFRTLFGAPTTVTSPLNLTVTGGGATKVARYEVVLVR